MAPVCIAIIGLGGVGKAFLNQLATLKLQTTSRPVVIFASRSSKQIYTKNYDSVDATTVDSSSSPLLSLSDLTTYLGGAPGKVILVDNTSNQDVANAYPSFLRKGISVVTPNKKAFSSNMQLWDDIFNSTSPSALVYHESSVGAGLPVISTLKDLVATGDQITKVQGVFSGTMSFLFNTFAPVDGSGKGKWSEIVSQAKDAGYTEPDPRDDLNGMDVARKCTILARLAGLKVAGPDSFPVQSLIPKQLESASSAAEFMDKLPQFDGDMESYKDNAAKAGKVVRFVASVDVAANEVKVGLEMVEKDSPIAALKGSDNIFVFHTKRYSSSPLVVQGSGAGGEVTAMGVSADLIKAIERLS
ncbi:Homoserine dehydrogenase [Neophaeococcomyces mojaviensis]|uniref:Homoserine dehydrogenase n=1 Tax=Neophaeococcomyces mojaviensis TaxID=3383035 RepID=A0ACC3AI70_9EURO|nr:Homoserine dehydrogenase [Knufia sp. JES_112]